jgi:hypothetical protein
MSKLGLVMVMILMVSRSNAQNYPAPGNEPLTFFVLIQADDGRAFFVRLNNQLYTSSSTGHLILAPLTDSVYTLAVGFPGLPEQRYLLNLHQKDWALRLKRQDKRWGLYDDKGQAIPAVADPASFEKPLLTGAKKDDAFSQLMSAIVQDTAVMYNTFVSTTPDSVQAAGSATSSPTGSATAAIQIIHDTVAPVTTNINPGLPPDAPATTNPAGAAPGPPVTGTPISSTIDPSVPSAPSGVVKLSEHKSSKSFRLVYEDHPANQRADTIDVVIPVDSAVAPHRPVALDTAHSATHHPQSPDTQTQTSRASDKPTLPFVNSDCHVFATDYDVDKLRVRMLDSKKDEDRIQAAYKVFKTKCFTSKQIRALSEVFAADPAKFKFLATAYPFVSDDQFPELVSLLTDPVYAGKFRTMTDRH